MRITHWLMPVVGVASLLAVAIASTRSIEPVALEVHEWGTFTSLQDEHGQALGSINTDDEPVPWFVHDIYPNLLAGASQLPPTLAMTGKGIVPKALPQITMRLETPVLYFHLPPHTPAIHVNVDVGFRGGWLTQFYPDAVAAAPGLTTQSISADPANGTLQWHDIVVGAISADPAGGTLQWHDITVGDDDAAHAGPVTQDPVWTAPRQVAAAPVLAPPVSRGNETAEHEQFLFYRGVGKLDSPVRVVRSGDALEFHGNVATPLAIPGAWLADIRADQSLAFRDVGPLPLSGHPADVAGSTGAAFDPSRYSPGNLADLRAALHHALQDQGLNADEAEALLNTWQASYFKSPGLRLLYIVPQTWTDEALPLSITSPSIQKPVTIRRAMIGRIEIVTPQQRALLRQMAAGPASDQAWIASAIKDLEVKDPTGVSRIRTGEMPLSKALDAPIPADYAAYLALGRFRQALLLDEQSRAPSAALGAFIRAYTLDAYGPAN